MKESFWDDLMDGRSKHGKSFRSESERLRDRYCVLEAYERRSRVRPDYRNGYCERDFVTRLGTIRLRIARTRKENCLQPACRGFRGARRSQRS